MNSIEQLIRAGKIKDAISALIEASQKNDTHIYNQAILLSARLENFERDKRLGLLDSDKELANITLAVLQTSNEYYKHERIVTRKKSNSIIYLSIIGLALIALVLFIIYFFVSEPVDLKMASPASNSEKVEADDRQRTTPKIDSMSANIEVAQFALNTDLCFYKTVITDASKIVIQPIDFLEDTISAIEMQIEESGGSAKSKLARNKYYPLLDVTFFNKGNQKTILTMIKVHVQDFSMEEGDGTIGGNLSHIIETLTKYEIIIPDLYDYFSNKSKRPPPFIKEYPTFPPLLVAPQDAARIQIVLGNKAASGATYTMLLEFIFSNGQSIRKKMIIDF